jgi:hypothetical protein
MELVMWYEGLRGESVTARLVVPTQKDTDPHPCPARDTYSFLYRTSEPGLISNGYLRISSVDRNELIIGLINIMV